MTGKHASPLRAMRRTVCGYTAFLVLLTVAIVLMPIGNAVKEETRWVMYGSGSFFWVGLVGVIGHAIALSSQRKKAGCTFKRTGGKCCGLIRFFSNKEATVADIVMLVSIVGFIVAMLCTDALWFVFACFALFVLSFGMHCLLNGINYRYIIRHR